MNKTRKIKKKHIQNTGDKNQCQCSLECKHKCFGKTPFCAFHQKGCMRKSPLSGYEPDYDPDHWNKLFKVKETHNCFAYAFNINDPKQMRKCKDSDCDIPFHQPGLVSGYPNFSSKLPKTCPNMMARLFGDNPQLKMATFEEKCPVGSSKIALIVDENEDYHFLRQDSNGYWSHKPGARKVTNRDASNRLIYDPALANYNYKDNNGHLDYDIFCGYMCVPRTGTVKLKTGGSKIIDTYKIAVLIKTVTNDLDFSNCHFGETEMLYNGPTRIRGYNHELQLLVKKDMLEQINHCFTNLLDDYKKNGAIEKYKIGVVTH